MRVTRGIHCDATTEEGSGGYVIVLVPVAYKITGVGQTGCVCVEFCNESIRAPTQCSLERVNQREIRLGKRCAGDIGLVERIERYSYCHVGGTSAEVSGIRQPRTSRVEFGHESIRSRRSGAITVAGLKSPGGYWEVAGGHGCVGIRGLASHADIS